MKYSVISADNHIVEARDAFQRFLPAALRDRAPRLVRGADGGDGWSFEGEMPAKTFGLETVAGRRYENYQNSGIKWEEILPGNYDGRAHLDDMAKDGVDAAVGYPTATLQVYAMKDRELAVACFRAYNDWLLQEFCAADPDRLVGLAALPVDDGMDVTVAELERVAGLGARGCFLPGVPKRPYHTEYYEPLWKRAAELGMPLNLHRHHGGAMTQELKEDHPIAGTAIRYFHSIRPLTNLIYAGVFDRYPDLRLVAAEVNMGWIPFWSQTVDQTYERQRHWSNLHLDRRPSEYLGTSIFVTVLDDYVGFAAVKDYPMLADCAMYSTDYPHSSCLWPHSDRYIAELTAGLSDEQRHKILAGNAVAVYKLPASHVAAGAGATTAAGSAGH